MKTSPLSIYNDVGRAEWFVRSKDPMVVLRMPGCYREVINGAHERWLEANAVKQVPKAETPDSFFALLKSSKRSKDTMCYCEEARFIISLRNEHCSFEDCYAQLAGQGYGPMCTSVAFKLETETEDSRTYRICRLFALRDDSKRGLSLLQGLIIPLQRLTLEVAGEYAENRDSLIKAQVFLDGTKETRCTSIEPCSNDLYVSLHKLLMDLVHRIKEGESEEEVHAWAIEASGKLLGENSQVLSIFARIFGQENDKVAALTKVSRRIFDVLAAQKIVRCIEEVITTELLQFPVKVVKRPQLRIPYRVIKN
jgi:hypothetical protein